MNLTSLEGPDPNDFYEDLSGAFWNPRQHRLRLCRNGGAAHTSCRGMGGLMFVGHQNGGALYAFDLDPNSGAFTFVGEYRTAYDESAALHFDRGNGRQLRAMRTFDGPHHRNNERLTLASIDECSLGFRDAFLATDGGGAESLTWFTRYAEGCTTLSVIKNSVSGTVELNWSGGVSPYTVLRAEDPLLINGRTRLVDEAPGTTLADPMLSDGKSYFYLVP